MYNYIVIEGNIGAGKTSLSTRMASELNAYLILEQFEENSFLPKFYEDPARYSFPLELSFLADRYQQLKNHFNKPDLFKSSTLADYFIFKSLIFASRNLEPLEYALYTRLFTIVSSVVPKPDLLGRNIQKRGRPYEQNIRFDYLEKIQNGYLEFLRQQTDQRILLLDTNNLDFVNNEDDYHWIKEQILNEYPIGIQTVIKPSNF